MNPHCERHGCSAAVTNTWIVKLRCIDLTGSNLSPKYHHHYSIGRWNEAGSDHSTNVSSPGKFLTAFGRYFIDQIIILEIMIILIIFSSTNMNMISFWTRANAGEYNSLRENGSTLSLHDTRPPKTIHFSFYQTPFIFFLCCASFIGGHGLRGHSENATFRGSLQPARWSTH